MAGSGAPDDARARRSALTRPRTFFMLVLHRPVETAGHFCTTTKFIQVDYPVRGPRPGLLELDPVHHRLKHEHLLAATEGRLVHQRGEPLARRFA